MSCVSSTWTHNSNIFLMSTVVWDSGVVHTAFPQAPLCAIAFHFADVDGPCPGSKIAQFCHTTTAQLSTSYISTSAVEIIITDCAPLPIVQQLHPSNTAILSSGQSDGLMLYRGISQSNHKATKQKITEPWPKILDDSPQTTSIASVQSSFAAVVQLCSFESFRMQSARQTPLLGVAFIACTWPQPRFWHVWFARSFCSRASSRSRVTSTVKFVRRVLRTPEHPWDRLNMERPTKVQKEKNETFTNRSNSCELMLLI